jgi:plastocyanin
VPSVSDAYGANQVGAPPARSARPATVRTVAAALVLVVALAGCSNREAAPNRRGHPGSTTASTTVNGVQQVTVAVNDTFRFDPSRITVHPGTVKIILVHQGSGAPHDFSLNSVSGDQTGLVRAGATTSTTFTTPAPGTYTFECTLHVAQGMTGTLVVLPN